MAKEGQPLPAPDYSPELNPWLPGGWARRRDADTAPSKPPTLGEILWQVGILLAIIFGFWLVVNLLVTPPPSP